MVHTGQQHQVQDALQQTVMLEGTMVDRNKYGAIQELARLGVSKKEISRQLGVTVKTVRRALKKPGTKGSALDIGQLDPLMSRVQG